MPRTTEELVASDVPKPLVAAAPRKSGWRRPSRRPWLHASAASVDVSMSGRRGRLTIRFADADDLTGSST
ncbi:MAG: hypothetical protein U0R27_02170 [Candidatus Nanopelagicales bacterium]